MNSNKSFKKSSKKRELLRNKN